ncbi:MAG: PepSY domain-containing protein [Steroidobacteraceae bacterium]
MQKTHWIAVAVVAAVLGAGGLGYAVRDGLSRHEHHEDARSVESASASQLALEDALRIAVDRVPGEVVKVERDEEHGVEVLEIKVLAANGRVREITLDARDGRVLELEDD